jgi:hypothetical protein
MYEQDQINPVESFNKFADTVKSEDDSFSLSKFNQPFDLDSYQPMMGLSPLTRGIAKGVAQGAKDKANEQYVFTNAKVNMQTPEEQQKAIKDNLAKQIKENDVIGSEGLQIAQELSSSSQRIQSLQKDITDTKKKKENLVLGIPDNTRYIQAFDELTGAIEGSPKPPKYQTPKLETQDQILVLLAGLIGGIDKMPQALQGVTQGAMTRATQSNQIAQANYENEMSLYGKNVQAKQNMLNKETSLLQNAQTQARQEYTTKYQSLADSVSGLETELNKILVSESTNKNKGLLLSQKAFDKWLGTLEVVDASTNEKIRAMQKAVAKAYNVPVEQVATLMPEQVEQETKYGKDIRLKKSYSDARIKYLTTITDIKTLDSLRNIIKNKVEGLTQFTGELTPAQATLLNKEIDVMVANTPGFPRYLLPTFVAGETMQKQKYDFDVEMEDEKLKLAREKFEYQQKQDKVSNWLKLQSLATSRANSRAYVQKLITIDGLTIGQLKAQLNAADGSISYLGKAILNAQNQNEIDYLMIEQAKAVDARQAIVDKLNKAPDSSIFNDDSTVPITVPDSLVGEFALPPSGKPNASVAKDKDSAPVPKGGGAKASDSSSVVVNPNSSGLVGSGKAVRKTK